MLLACSHQDSLIIPTFCDLSTPHKSIQRISLTLSLFSTSPLLVLSMAPNKHKPTKHAYTLLILLLLSGTLAKNVTEDVVLPVPVGTTEYKMMMYDMNDMNRRRKLGPFQVCLVCRCCVMASDPTTCSDMPCCFGIDCQLPNKPFGVCAFVPKTCNCTTCA